ncbi:MAG: alpha-1,2-fucosyltransferase, partial [Chthoniobacteraceae bacterium]
APVLKLGFRLFRMIHRWKNLVHQMTRGFVGFVEVKYPAVADMKSPEFLEGVRSSRVVFISGYFFEAKGLFAKHAGAIRRQFEFSEATRRNGGAYIDGLREPGLEIVGVHIRHGDFREYCGGRWFYSAGQYAQVMRWVVANHPERRFRFVVCSDAAQSPEAFAGLDVRIHASDYHADLQVLILCDCIISTSSSFARAAAFLGDIPLLRIFDPDLPASHQFVAIEYLEEGWHWESEMARVFGDARGDAARTGGG